MTTIRLQLSIRDSSEASDILNDTPWGRGHRWNIHEWTFNEDQEAEMEELLSFLDEEITPTYEASITFHDFVS